MVEIYSRIGVMKVAQFNKIGKVCIYIKKLSDIDQKKLKLLMKETIAWLHKKYSKI
jgi:hypothetical protein